MLAGVTQTTLEDRGVRLDLFLVLNLVLFGRLSNDCLTGFLQQLIGQFCGVCQHFQRIDRGYQPHIREHVTIEILTRIGMAVHIECLRDIDPRTHLEVIKRSSLRHLIADLKLQRVPVMYLTVDSYHVNYIRLIYSCRPLTSLKH